MLVEVAVVALVLIIVMIFVELTPYLVSSADESIGVYQGKEFRKGTATIAKGQSVRVEYFNYSTFDPAILVVNIEFQTWQSTGTLIIIDLRACLWKCNLLHLGKRKRVRRQF
jgi:hypothetical protein